MPKYITASGKKKESYNKYEGGKNELEKKNIAYSGDSYLSISISILFYHQVYQIKLL